MGDVHPVASRVGRRPGARPFAARAPPGSRVAHRLGAARPRPLDDPLPPADDGERHAGLLGRIARPGGTRRDLRGPRRPEPLDPAAGRHRRRLVGAIARDVGTGTRCRGLRGARCRLRRRARRGPRPAASVGLAGREGLPGTLRSVPVRPRRARPERVRRVRHLLGGQAAHRARRDRPDAPLRRLAGPEHPQRRSHRRARPDRRRHPGTDRR